MFDIFKKILLGEIKNQNSASPANSTSDEKKLQIAACAILLEMAKSDDNCTDDELNEILKIMQKMFNLDKDYAEKLIEAAKSRLIQSISIYEFTGIINDHFTREQKFELMKNLWRLIYSDRRLDRYEDQLVKKIGAMLLLEHKNVIAAKLIVKEENT